MYMIPIGAMREEGTSPHYAPVSYPAIADFELVRYLTEGVVENGGEAVNGMICTMDAFYRDFRESRFSLECGVDGQHITEKLEQLRKLGIDSVDMESSAIFTIARLMGVKAALIGLATVNANLQEFMYGEEKARNEAILCKVALDGLVKYAHAHE